MDLTTEAEMLRKVPMFAKLELSKLKLLAFTSELCTYDDKEVLFEAGDAPDSAYVIMKGAVDILADTKRDRWSKWCSAATSCSESSAC